MTQTNTESIDQETVYEKSNNLPVAEIIKCPVMGQQTIKEIEGRLKFLRIGDKLYTQPPQAAQTVEPVAWQWLDSGTFRKTLPKTAVVSDWNPLFKNFPTIAQPAPARKPLTDEQDRALCEAHCNTESDAFFTARPVLDSVGNHRIFYAGHRKAWINYSTLVAAISQPVEPAETDDLTIAYMSGLADGKKATQPKQPVVNHEDFKESVGLMFAVVGYTEEYARQWPKEKVSITFKRWFDEQIATAKSFAQPAPARQPLTHTEIVRAYDASMSDWVYERDNPYVKFARAIEAAHGITTPESKK